MLEPSLNDHFCQEPKELEIFSYPGEYCKKDQHCLSGDCDTKNKVCRGVKLDGECTGHDECAPGLRCHLDVCKPQLEVGETGCLSYNDCVNHATCHIESGFSGTCIEFFSLPDGSEVKDCYDNQSYSCSSGSCFKTSHFNHHGVCIDAPKSDHFPQECLGNSDCKGKSKDYEFESVCNCGKNSEGTSYCNPFLGDAPGKNYLHYLKKFFEGKHNSHCNTTRSFTEECVKSSNYNHKVDLLTYEMQFHFYSQYVDNDKCVSEIYNQSYWEVSGAESLGLTLLVLGLVF